MMSDITPQNSSSSTPVMSTQMTATDTVFEKLLADIVSGTYPAGARLPAERDLARQLGASRPTLREALRRLGEWNLVLPRRGSGIAVRPQSEWMLEVLPSYLRYAEPGPDAPPTAQMVTDLLHLRRSLMREILAMVAKRVPASALVEARARLQKAWELRDSGAEFAAADLGILRAIAQGAKFLPGMWMINRMSGIYTDLASSLGAMLAPPEGYVPAWESVFTALEEGRCDDAVETLDQYFAGHDERLLAILELMK